MAPLRICLFLEGSYPFITGGVSAWVHDLITGLPDLDFALFTLSPEANQSLRYTLPANVRDHVDVVLSGPPPPNGRGPRVRDWIPLVVEAHLRAFQGREMDLTRLIEGIPEGWSPRQAALSRDAAWRLLVDRNQEKNPIYPFADYLWAWRGSHELVFRVLAARPPEADLYHAVSTGFAGLAALAAQIRRRRPFLLTEHGLYHKEREMEIRKAGFLAGYQRDLWTGLYARLSRECYRAADLTTALFEANRRHQIALGARPERTRVVPNGIDLARFSAVVRRPRPGFHVGLVGRVVPIKDIKTFIAACKILAEAWPDAEFHCVGPTDEDRDYAEECQRLVESLRLGDRFHFTGRQNVLEYYAFLDVMLLTSVREAQPLVILEAWCAGVPVVSTRVGNVPEMLDYDPRFLADTKDAEGLARGVRWIRNNPDEMQTILKRQQRKAAEVYDKRTLMATFRSIYEEARTSWRA